MATGDDLLQRLADLIPEYSKGTSAEDNRALRHLNQVQELLAADLRAIGEDYLLVSATMSTVANQKRYGLPSNFHAIRYLEFVEVDATDETNRIYPMSDIPDKEWAEGSYRRYLDSSTSVLGKPVYYLLAGDFLEFRPIADDTYTIRIWYTQTLDAITSGGTVELPLALTDALVYGAAIRERIYRRDEIGDVDRQFEKARHRGLEALETRQQDGPNRVTYTNEPAEYV